jgi:hypothetical protein
LVGTKCADVEFIGPFDDVCITEADFTGSKGAKINPQTIYEKNLDSTKCADVEFIGSFNDVGIEFADFTGSNYEEIINIEENFRGQIKQFIKIKKK